MILGTHQTPVKLTGFCSSMTMSSMSMTDKTKLQEKGFFSQLQKHGLGKFISIESQLSTYFRITFTK